jgi:hypothetical protein
MSVWLGRLWRWIGGRAEAAVTLPLVGGALSAAERRELRRWLELTLEGQRPGRADNGSAAVWRLEPPANS